MMFRSVIVLSLLNVAWATGVTEGALITLQFSAPIPGTINDMSGLGTGFTTRLPGSGSSIAANDPSMTLDTVNHRLLLNSSRSDFNTTGFGRNLPALEGPSLLLSGIGGDDFIIEATFIAIHVDQLSDQMGIFAGTSVDNVFRAGAHEFNSSSTYQCFAGFSTNGTDTSGFGAVGIFSAGDTGLLQLGRIHGGWFYRAQNLTQPSLSFTTPSFMLPLIDSQPHLYVGVFNNDARNFVSQQAIIGSFSVRTGADVPEPGSASIWIMFGVLGLAGACWLRRTQGVVRA